jgi:hypothetical protein
VRVDALQRMQAELEGRKQALAVSEAELKAALAAELPEPVLLFA